MPDKREPLMVVIMKVLIPSLTNLAYAAEGNLVSAQKKVVKFHHARLVIG